MPTTYTPEQMQQMARSAASAYPKDPNAASTILAKAQNNPQFMQQLIDRYAYKFGGPRQVDRGVEDISLDNMIFSALHDGESVPAQQAPVPPTKSVATTASSRASSSARVPTPTPKPQQQSAAEEAAEGSASNPAEEAVETPVTKGDQAGSEPSITMMLGALAATGYGTAYGANKAYQAYTNYMSANNPKAPMLDEQTFTEMLPAPEEMKLLMPPKTVQGAAQLPAPDVIYGQAPEEQRALPSPDTIYAGAPEEQRAITLDPSSELYDAPYTQQPGKQDYSAIDARIKQAFDQLTPVDEMIGAALNDGVKPNVRMRAETETPRIRLRK